MIIQNSDTVTHNVIYGGRPVDVQTSSVVILYAHAGSTGTVQGTAPG